MLYHLTILLRGRQGSRRISGRYWPSCTQAHCGGSIRGCASTHKHPIPIYAPVFWAATGVVYAFPPLWRFGDKDEERYAIVMPNGSHIAGKEAHEYVRVSDNPDEAVKFLGNENASPVRMHLMSSPHQGIFKPKSCWAAR